MSAEPRLRVGRGGSGFLGRGLRERLVDDGNEVTVIGRGTEAVHDGWKAAQGAAVHAAVQLSRVRG